MTAEPGQVNAVVAGAGFGGLSALHALRDAGLGSQCFEAGDGVAANGDAGFVLR